MNQRIFALMRLTFTEGIRDRALIGITIIAGVMLIINILITNLFGHELGKVMVDLHLSTIAFAGLLLTFFVNINLMAKDVDKRTIYCVLSKPFSRTEYIIGKYLGLLLLVMTALGSLALISSAIAWLVVNSNPEYFFKSFNWSCYFQAIYYSLLMFTLLNAIVVFFTSFSSNSFLTMLFSVATYIAGQSIEDLIVFFSSESKQTGLSSPMNELVITIFQYIFPNLSAFDIKTMASHGKLMPLEHTMTLTGYSLIYSTLLIFLAANIFKRREFT